MVTQSIADITLIEFLFVYMLATIFVRTIGDFIGKLQSKYVSDSLLHYFVFISFFLFIFSAILYIFGPELRRTVLGELA